MRHLLMMGHSLQATCTGLAGCSYIKESLHGSQVHNLLVKLACWMLASPGASVCLWVPVNLWRAALAACDQRLLLPSLAYVSRQAAYWHCPRWQWMACPCQQLRPSGASQLPWRLQSTRLQQGVGRAASTRWLQKLADVYSIRAREVASPAFAHKQCCIITCIWCKWGLD